MEDNLENRLKIIEDRNIKVELDKRWETSLTRKITIAFLTYVTFCLYFAFVLKINPWINALVPTGGFLLSTLSLSLIRDMWKKLVK